MLCFRLIKIRRHSPPSRLQGGYKMSQQTAWIVLGIVFSIATIGLPIKEYVQRQNGKPFAIIDWFIIIVCAMIAIISWLSVFGLFD